MVVSDRGDKVIQQLLHTVVNRTSALPVASNDKGDSLVETLTMFGRGCNRARTALASTPTCSSG